jgi:hypothetical protein
LQCFAKHSFGFFGIALRAPQVTKVVQSVSQTHRFDVSFAIFVPHQRQNSPGVNSRLANISTRGFVETGSNVMIGGLIIGPAGGSSATVVVRAIGPSLAGISGALQDPTLELKDANGSTLISNDDWQQGQPTEIQLIGLAPTDSRESALLATLPPSNYTAIVRGAGNTTGVGLVEVYHVQ